MSDTFDHEADAWNAYHRGDDDEPDDVTCKFCKRRGFHWGEHWNAAGKPGFRLFTVTNRLHDCRHVTPDPDAFDVVPE